jgi:predicted secreted protein
MAVNNANIISLFLSGTKAAVATSHELSLSQDTIEVTSKDSSGKAEYLPGKRDGTISIEGFVDPNANEFADIFNLYGSTVSFEYNDSNKKYTGNAIVTELTRSGENDSPETFSASLQITGFVTESAA